MVRMYVFTLGFTSEFVIKPLLEVGVGRDAYIIIIYTLAGDDYSRRRVKDAVAYIEKLAREGGFLNRTFFQQVSLGNTFYDTVYEIAVALNEVTRKLGKKDVKKVDVWLTGGMRILVVATLIACKIVFEYLDIPVEYHVWSEDGAYKYKFGLSLIGLNLRGISKARMEILKRIVYLGEASYEELVSAKRKEATIRKMAELLRKDGLIYCERRGRRTLCRATELGKLIVKIAELT